MPIVRDVLSGKGSEVHSTQPSATVLEAVNRMNEYKIGAMVVMDGEQVVGMFTERDVLQRVVGEGRTPSATRVHEVMTSEVCCCLPNADLDEVGAVMRNRRIRHVPVCDKDGALLGLVSIGDLNAYNASNQEAALCLLNDYVYGRA